MNDLPFPQSIKLKKGSHELPSEGSCAMEVAILAAGYAWEQVNSASDLPPCMSRVLGAYVIRLNDSMPDAQRQRLLSFVTRMSGTAGTPEVELKRAEYLVMNAAKPAAVFALRSAGLHDAALRVQSANTIEELGATSEAARAASWAASEAASEAARAASWAASEAASWAAIWAASEAARVASEAAIEFDWDPYLEALEGALAIGPKAPPIESAIAAERTRELVTA